MFETSCEVMNEKFIKLPTVALIGGTAEQRMHFMKDHLDYSVSTHMFERGATSLEKHVKEVQYLMRGEQYCGIVILNREYALDPHFMRTALNCVATAANLVDCSGSDLIHHAYLTAHEAQE